MIELEQRTTAAARGPIPVTVYATPLKPDVVERYIGAGAHRIVFNLPQVVPGEELAAIDEVALLIRPFI
jgi:hypothetical protein